MCRRCSGSSDRWAQRLWGPYGLQSQRAGADIAEEAGSGGWRPRRVVVRAEEAPRPSRPSTSRLGPPQPCRNRASLMLRVLRGGEPEATKVRARRDGNQNEFSGVSLLAPDRKRFRRLDRRAGRLRGHSKVGNEAYVSAKQRSALATSCRSLLSPPPTDFLTNEHVDRDNGPRFQPINPEPPS